MAGAAIRAVAAVRVQVVEVHVSAVCWCGCTADSVDVGEGLDVPYVGRVLGVAPVPHGGPDVSGLAAFLWDLAKVGGAGFVGFGG